MSRADTTPSEAAENAIFYLDETLNNDPLIDSKVALAWATTSIAMSLIEIREIMGNAEYGDRAEAT